MTATSSIHVDRSVSTTIESSSSMLETKTTYPNHSGIGETKSQNTSTTSLTTPSEDSVSMTTPLSVYSKDSEETTTSIPLPSTMTIEAVSESTKQSANEATANISMTTTTATELASTESSQTSSLHDNDSIIISTEIFNNDNKISSISITITEQTTLENISTQSSLLTVTETLSGVQSMTVSQTGLTDYLSESTTFTTPTQKESTSISNSSSEVSTIPVLVESTTDMISSTIPITVDTISNKTNEITNSKTDKTDTNSPITETLSVTGESTTPLEMPNVLYETEIIVNKNNTNTKETDGSFSESPFVTTATFVEPSTSRVSLTTEVFSISNESSTISDIAPLTSSSTQTLTILTMPSTNKLDLSTENSISQVVTESKLESSKSDFMTEKFVDKVSDVTNSQTDNISASPSVTIVDESSISLTTISETELNTNSNFESSQDTIVSATNKNVFTIQNLTQSSTEYNTSETSSFSAGIESKSEVKSSETVTDPIAYVTGNSNIEKISTLNPETLSTESFETSVIHNDIERMSTDPTLTESTLIADKSSTSSTLWETKTNSNDDSKEKTMSDPTNFNAPSFTKFSTITLDSTSETTFPIRIETKSDTESSTIPAVTDTIQNEVDNNTSSQTENISKVSLDSQPLPVVSQTTIPSVQSTILYVTEKIKNSNSAFSENSSDFMSNTTLFTAQIMTEMSKNILDSKTEIFTDQTMTASTLNVMDSTSYVLTDSITNHNQTLSPTENNSTIQPETFSSSDDLTTALETSTVVTESIPKTDYYYSTEETSDSFSESSSVFNPCSEHNNRKYHCFSIC